MLLKNIKADLHMHGPIGLQKYWLKSQGYGITNPLEEISKHCFDKNIEICAITSDENEIPRNSVHDRFNWLKNNCIKNLPENYKTGDIGKNILVVNHKNKQFYLINGQTVRAKDNGRQVDHLVIGSNNISIGQSLDYTLKHIQDKNLISIAEHPLCISHGGIGKKNLEKILPYITAIEGHNSQLIFGNSLDKLPIFKNYSKKINEQTKRFAKDHKKPWIATSDAHRIEDLGISYIEFSSELLDIRNEEAFLESLKNIIRSNNFTKHCAYENTINWINWVSKFIIGTKLGKDKE